MREILTAEAVKAIGEFFLAWGTPGVIILFLLEERRRLMKQIGFLQKKLDASLEARIKTNNEADKVIAQHAGAIGRLESLVTNIIFSRGNKGGSDV